MTTSRLRSLQFDLYIHEYHRTIVIKSPITKRVTLQSRECIPNHFATKGIIGLLYTVKGQIDTTQISVTQSLVWTVWERQLLVKVTLQLIKR